MFSTENAFEESSAYLGHTPSPTVNSLKEVECPILETMKVGQWMCVGQVLRREKDAIAKLLSRGPPKVRGGVANQRLCEGELSRLSKKTWAGEAGMR